MSGWPEMPDAATVRAGTGAATGLDESAGTAPVGRVEVEVLLHEDEWAAHLADETRRGLTSAQPWIPPVWFYDERGSDLFDQITELPEYYPTRTERAILTASATDIVRQAGARTLVELGAGSADKTHLLLGAAVDQGLLKRFVAVDCSQSALETAGAQVLHSYPQIEVHVVVADFNAHMSELEHSPARLVVFLGSTIGNFDPVQRQVFLAELAADLDPGDHFLLGTDLVKEADRLVAAYDDPAGVTAAFNLNALRVLNRALGADFDPDQYHHRAVWNAPEQRIEMHLVARTDQQVVLTGLDDLTVRLHAGEHLRTEISTKFTAAQVTAELAAVGLQVVDRWTDPDGDFLLTLARPVPRES